VAQRVFLQSDFFHKAFMAHFDHIEVHVSDIPRYCSFLQAIFEGGSFEVISKTGTSMFTAEDGLRIEVKKKKGDELPLMYGFCNPCLRRPDPPTLISKLGLEVASIRETDMGPVYFFRDHEGVTWHIKDLPE
jgi:hypothetical protein